MKIISLTIKNIGLIADCVIEFNQPLLLFYGEIRNGKTTILNAVRWVCGGGFPSDIIRHGEQEASVELSFEGGMISRSWYRSKGGHTKARDVVFIRDGKPVSSPVAEIRKFLNPFMLDQDFLRNKTEDERRKYFAELFAVDTTELDKEWFDNDRKATALRATIKGYGVIDVNPVERVNADDLKNRLEGIRIDRQREIAALNKELSKIGEDYKKLCADADAKIQGVISHNANWDGVQTAVHNTNSEIEQLELRIQKLRDDNAERVKWLNDNPKLDAVARPTEPDTTSIKAKILALYDEKELEPLKEQISNAAAQNVRAEQYEANKKRADQRAAEEKQLEVLEKRQRAIKAEKQSKLKELSNSSGIKGLEFDPEGNFIYEGSQAGMLSTSQIMRLSSELSAMYPQGFGLELLDRGESLGRAIFDYVELAKKNKSTVMATVVGQRPATVPAEIGVFVVKDGVVIKDETPGELL